MTTMSTHTFGTRGLSPVRIDVFAEPAERLEIVGLASEAAKREAQVRVRCACERAGFDPRARVTVRPHHAGSVTLDLAIALAALGASGALGDRPLPAVFGALGLDGTIGPVRGLFAALAGVEGTAIVPTSQRWEAGLTRGPAWHAARLDDVVEWTRDAWDLAEVEPRAPELCRLEFLAGPPRECLVGPKSLLLVGPHGSGATRTARRIAAQLQVPEPSVVWDAFAIWSKAGLLPTHDSSMSIPFRAPHHTVSDAGLVGSGERPGEVSLAHGGCLYLDEVSEFRRSAMNALRDERFAFPGAPQIIIGSCTPKELPRARSLYPWTREFDLEEAIRLEGAAS
ncbi:MAG: hypothetical protein AMXMBFR56_65700 [Polyangiaceae bacterium]